MGGLPSKTILHKMALGFSTLLLLIACINTAAERSGEDSPKMVTGTASNYPPGVHSQTMSVDGTEREFSFFIPGKPAGKDLPIVIYLHGYGDSMRHMLGQGIVSSASSKWMDVAEREGFLVFYPLGLKGEGSRAKTGWNDCRRDAAGNPKADDVAFIRQMINFAVEKLNGDRRRVYVTGMSNGGQMTMRVAMEMSREVAAVAPIVALLPKSNTCSPPAVPVPILMMHGTADPIAPFEGGSMKGGRGEVLSARDTANTWVKWNGLERSPEKTSEVADKDPSDESRIIIRSRQAASNGNAVIAYEIKGGGHTEPSQRARMNRMLKLVQGNQNNDIEMADTIWEFFKTRSRDAPAPAS